MSWYFAMCLVMNLVFGVWGAVTVNKGAVAGIAAMQLRETCGLINNFLIIFAVL